MNDNIHVTIMPGAVYNANVEQQNVFPALSRVENHYAQCAPQAEDHTREQTRREAEAAGLRPCVTHPDKADSVIALLHKLADRQSQPKDIAMPVRAAMDAGAIRRPTWGQFCAEFGEGKISSKSLFTKYTSTDYRYEGQAFWHTKQMFTDILES